MIIFFGFKDGFWVGTQGFYGSITAFLGVSGDQGASIIIIIIIVAMMT